jgi:hypothetical protein
MRDQNGIVLLWQTAFPSRARDAGQEPKLVFERQREDRTTAVI